MRLKIIESSFEAIHFVGPYFHLFWDNSISDCVLFDSSDYSFFLFSYSLIAFAAYSVSPSLSLFSVIVSILTFSSSLLLHVSPVSLG